MSKLINFIGNSFLFGFVKADVAIAKVVIHTIVIPIIILIATHNIINVILYQIFVGRMYQIKYRKPHRAKTLFFTFIKYEIAFALSFLFVVLIFTAF